MHASYIAYALIPFFFCLGLLGVLICHILKKRGYRCTTEAEQEEEVLGEKIGRDDLHNPTIVVITGVGKSWLHTSFAFHRHPAGR